jgi:hypothetical protein
MLYPIFSVQRPGRPSQASLTLLRCFTPAVGDMLRSTPAGGRIAAGSGASPRTDEVIE